MVKIFGMMVAIAGICFGVYVGFWVLFVGGIVDIIDTIKSPVTDAGIIALGILKIMMASFCGAVIAWIGVAVGALCGFSSLRFRYGRKRRF